MNRRLTKAQLATVLEAIAENPIDGILAAWRIIEPRWDDLDTIRPGDYRIPRPQWHAICEALSKAGKGSDQFALTWMNVGPSAREAA